MRNGQNCPNGLGSIHSYAVNCAWVALNTASKASKLGCSLAYPVYLTALIQPLSQIPFSNNFVCYFGF
ncbi:hypothetical protein PRUB_a2378 [Pseudoalteromonas rubra]|uniref:Uncharacterized protein n=1 Tax=Pseudoalteromonas rubra TaxID=43658 RepID=A0A8T0CCZ1_9GAMM|nr:hypothetical protein PRUB_a2378 [Pseudoalteromonas rubra]